MYDRRVVRGNTFAALVIPVSKWSTNFHHHHHLDMQPDPAMIERQKQETMMKYQQTE